MRTNFKALSKATSGITRKFGRVGLALKKHAPEILLVTGTASIIAGGVTACKSTLKAREVLEEMNDDLDAIHEAKEEVEAGKIPAEKYTEKDYKLDIVKTYGQYGLRFAKLYAPSIILTGLGIASIFASNNIMRKRCASLSAAYVTLDSMFKRYRKNVVEKYGEDVDREMRYGKPVKTEIEVTDAETGKTKKVKADIVDDKTLNLDGYSDYARFWDESCDGFYTDESGRPNTDCNLFYLKAREKEANVRLRAQGYLFLNDVYKMLGIQPSIAGQSVGWIYDRSKDEAEQEFDGCVSFNIYKGSRANARFIEGIEDVILLDFNVDGPILDRLKGTLARV
ncbi:MAG: hypothetical protein J6Y02_06375 [Pseudobutyrivibrio sp.]|nr:hypothetical protein [Pseudobutyrivibrio sp.]